MDRILTKHFKQKEFDSEDCPFSGAAMSEEVVWMLEALRRILNIKMPVNSGFRTPAHNKAEGGAPQSGHLEGLAVDIGTSSWTTEKRRDFIVCARKLGFRGIGIAKTFIHIDMKPRDAAWIYEGGKTIGIQLADAVKYA